MPRAPRPYPSDLTDEEWALLEPLLESSERHGKPTKWPLKAPRLCVAGQEDVEAQLHRSTKMGDLYRVNRTKVQSKNRASVRCAKAPSAPSWRQD
jgi:transposase